MDATMNTDRFHGKDFYMNTIITLEGRRARFAFGQAQLSLTYAGDKGWRLQSERNGIFDDFGAGQILARDLKEEPRIVREEITVEELGASWRVSETSGTSVLISDSRIEFCDEDGLSKAVLFSVSDDGTNASVTGLLHEEERIYGTGERFNTLNQRGKRLEIMAIDKWCQTEGNSYVPIPFFITSRCLGLFMNRYEHSILDLGASVADRFTIEQYNAPLDLYVFLGDRPQKLLFAYARITGFAPVPADWLYGTQVCRYAPDFRTTEGVLDMAEQMKKNDFPWDAVILEGWPTYDAKRFDELAQLSETLHAQGKKVMLYQACARVPSNAASDFAMDEDFVLANAETGERALPDTDSYNPADNPTRRTSRYVDITDPDAMDWWLGTVWGTLVNGIGIDGAKIDFCEQFPDHLPVAFADGRPAAGAHHWYPTLYNALMYNHFSTRPEGGMCLSRGGGIGAQRYPFLWAGDQLREFPFLGAILRAVLSSGMSGIPFMSYDMAAYRPARNQEENPENEVFLRGLEYTAFSANIQTHGLVKRPYDFDEHTKDVYRAYAKLHDMLRPYLIEQGKVACTTALPLMRQLFLYDCTDERCFDIEDEYMLGGALLVAPVLNRAESRDIYLPVGTWQNIFDGKIYEGQNMLYDYPVPLESVPVFRLTTAATQTLSGVLDNARPLLDEIIRLSEH